MLSLCGSADRVNIEITYRVFTFLDTRTLCQSTRVSSTWRRFISYHLTQNLKSLPVHREAINKSRLITYAPELLCIYAGKKKQTLQFTPVEGKKRGTALGTIFEKVSWNIEKPMDRKSWQSQWSVPQ